MNSPQTDKNSPNPLGFSKELIDLFARASLVDVRNLNEYTSIMKEIESAISSFSISNPTAHEKLKNSEQFKLFEFAMNQAIRDEKQITSVEDEKIDFIVSEEILKKADELDIDRQQRKRFFEIETDLEEDEKESKRLWQKQEELAAETREVFKKLEDNSRSFENLRQTRVVFLSSHSNKIKRADFVPEDHPNIEPELQKAIRFFEGDPHECCASSFIFYCKKGYLDQAHFDLAPKFGFQLKQTYVQTNYSKQLFKLYDKNEKFQRTLEEYIKRIFFSKTHTL
jgi:hypothetical protein